MTPDEAFEKLVLPEYLSNREIFDFAWAARQPEVGGLTEGMRRARDMEAQALKERDQLRAQVDTLQRAAELADEERVILENRKNQLRADLAAAKAILHDIHDELAAAREALEKISFQAAKDPLLLWLHDLARAALKPTDKEPG